MIKFFLPFLLLSYPIFAQKDSIKQLPSLEVTSARLNAFAIGQTYQSADSMHLALYNAQHLADFLQAETPLSIRRYGTGLSSVVSRGLSANHTALVWNGINLQNPLSGLNDMALVEVGAVQRIDVKMGGNSALFGSGAIGGAIYLDNERPRKQGFEAQIGYGNGSFGWENGQIQLDYSKNKISTRVRYTQQRAKNNFWYRNTAEIGQPLERAENAAFKMQNLNIQFFAELRKKDFLKVCFWETANYRALTPTMTAANDAAFMRDSATRLMSEWTHFFKNSYLKTRMAYIFDRNFYNSNTVKNSYNNIHSKIAETEWNYDFSKKHLLRLGVNAISDRSENVNYSENQTRNRFAFFINDALQTSIATFTASIRQEWLKKWQPTTFSVGAERDFSKNTAKNAWILRGGLSRNFNVPSFNDLYWAGLGNPDLATEQGWSRELGISFKDKKTGKIQAHLTLFDIDMKNRIVWLPQSNGIWRPSNLNRVQSRGLELWGRLMGQKGNFSYKVQTNYQYAHATDGNGGVQLFVPKHSFNAHFSANYRLFYASWQQSASSRRYATTDKMYSTAPFTVADFALGYAAHIRQMPKIRGDIRLNISNVFNIDYQVIRFYPNPKRQYSVEFLVKF